jgi:hypothetical protein
VRVEDLVVEKEAGALVEMLMNGSIDLLAYEEISTFNHLENLGADTEDYEIVSVLGVYDLYYAFNANWWHMPAIPDWPART